MWCESFSTTTGLRAVGSSFTAYRGNGFWARDWLLATWRGHDATQGVVDLGDVLEA
jgi:hypothetical protein